MKTLFPRWQLYLVAGFLVAFPAIASSEPALDQLAPPAFRLPPPPPIELDLSAEMDQARAVSLTQFRQKWRAEDGLIVDQFGQFDMPPASNSLFKLSLAEEAQETLAGFLAAYKDGSTHESGSESLAAN